MVNFDIGAAATSVLNAAQSAAGGTWEKIQHDFSADLEGVVRSAANIALQLERGRSARKKPRSL